MESRWGAGPTVRLRQLHLETTNGGAAGGRSRGCTPQSPGEAQDSETGGQAHDVGLQRRSFIFGLHDDLFTATERVCTVLGDWVSQARKEILQRNQTAQEKLRLLLSELAAQSKALCILAFLGRKLPEPALSLGL